MPAESVLFRKKILISLVKKQPDMILRVLKNSKKIIN